MGVGGGRFGWTPPPPCGIVPPGTQTLRCFFRVISAVGRRENGTEIDVGESVGIRRSAKAVARSLAPPFWLFAVKQRSAAAAAAAAASRPHPSRSDSACFIADQLDCETEDPADRAALCPDICPRPTRSLRTSTLPRTMPPRTTNNNQEIVLFSVRHFLFDFNRNHLLLE